MGRTFEEFREAMKEEVEGLLGKGTLVTATNTMKLNGTMKRGLTVTEKGEEDSMDLEDLGDTVRHINREEVLEEDVLSDQVYLYKRETDQVCMAMKQPFTAG